MTAGMNGNPDGASPASRIGCIVSSVSASGNIGWRVPLLLALFVLSAISAPAVAQRRNAAAPAASAAPPAVALNRALARGFGRRTGTGVVLDVSSGRILAAKNIAVAARRLVFPGSSIKPFVLYALLESRKLSPNEAFVCPYRLTIDGHRLHCTHPENMGPLSPASALAYSCNNFFARMALRLTPAELARALAQWGFTSPSRLAGDELSGEIFAARTPGELQLEALGEYGIHVTPLELLQAYRRLAVRRRDAATHGASLKVVFEGLEGSVQYGMAVAAKTEGLSVAGKTGTARSDEGAWTHGWFAGYAPADAPEIAVMIFLERGRGPTDAAGIAHTVFAAYRDSRAPR
jgi:cell division protein FtsI/penicillin-binding protein 2